MGFRINRGIFQYKKDDGTFANKFMLDKDSGRIMEVDEGGNMTDGYLKLGEKASDSDKLDGIDSGAFLRSNADDNVSANTEWQDHKQIRLGNGADLRMWHDGNNHIFRSYHHGANYYFQLEDNEGTNRNAIILEGNTSRSYVKLYEDGGERLRTTSTGINIYGTARVSGGITSTNSGGYGIIRGYDNDNHFIVIRGAVTTGQSTLEITGAHKTTFVEHANDSNEGWYFVSKASGNYTEKARIDGLGNIYSSNIITNQANIQSLTSDGTIANDKGSYLHLGGWAVSRTHASAVLVNTAYRADYATSLFNENISRFANDANYLTQDALTDLEEGLRAEINTAQTTADSKLGATAKAADSEKVDGIDSSRIVYGANARRSTRYDGNGIVSTNQNSGFYYGYHPDGAPYNEWWNWLTVAGASWTSGNNYDFKIAHDFHNDAMYVSRMDNGTQRSWRKVWDSGNFDPDSKLGATAKAADSDKLDGYDWMQSGKNVRGSEVYADGWLRNYNTKKGLYNQATGQHFYSDDDDYWNIAGGTAANGLRFRDEHDGTVRGYVYANNSNQVGFLDAGGTWAIKHVNDSHTEFQDAGEKVFSVGQGGHGSNYGTVCTHGGGRGGWEGYSINGRFVWMSADSSMSGMYNDTDNEWMTQYHRNGAVRLYHNGGFKFETTSSGVSVSGNVVASGSVTASSFSGNGSGLTGVSAPIPFTTVTGEATACVSMNFDGRAMVFIMADGTSYSIDGARPNQ